MESQLSKKKSEGETKAVCLTGLPLVGFLYQVPQVFHVIYSAVEYCPIAPVLISDVKYGNFVSDTLSAG